MLVVIPPESEGEAVIVPLLSIVRKLDATGKTGKVKVKLEANPGGGCKVNEKVLFGLRFLIKIAPKSILAAMFVLLCHTNVLNPDTYDADAGGVKPEIEPVEPAILPD